MNMDITQDNIKQVLSSTNKLFNHIFWFKQDFGLLPKKEHIGSAINYNDIKERRDDFLQELTYTITSWVYNNQKQSEIFKKRLQETDLANASAFLTNLARSKFRADRPQGQFGELLLFNFIQYFFYAAPLLRKQPITTSTGLERFGADAIHFKIEDNNNVFILGEAKCYESKYKFRCALWNALQSITDTYTNFDKELNLYVYDDFIDPLLQDIAKRYKEGTLTNVRFELVCIVVYNETKKITKDNERDIKEEIKRIICEKCQSFDESLFDKIDSKVLKRINYIVFPIWDLDKLLDDFTQKR